MTGRTWAAVLVWWILAHCLLYCSADVPELTVCGLACLLFLAIVAARGQSRWTSVAITVVGIGALGQIVVRTVSTSLLPLFIAVLVGWMLRRIAVCTGRYPVSSWPALGLMLAWTTALVFAPATGTVDLTGLAGYWSFDDTASCLLYVSLAGLIFVHWPRRWSSKLMDLMHHRGV